MGRDFGPAKRQRVLAVGDEPHILAAIVSALEASDTICTARSGVEAQTLLAR